MINKCPSGLSHPARVVKFARVASVVVQVEGTDHLSETHHVGLYDPLEGPGVLVVLLHLLLLPLHLCQTLSAHHLGT